MRMGERQVRTFVADRPGADGPYDVNCRSGSISKSHQRNAENDEARHKNSEAGLQQINPD